MTIDLDAIDALAQKADGKHTHLYYVEQHEPWTLADDDAEFLEHARDNVLALVAELRRQYAITQNIRRCFACHQERIVTRAAADDEDDDEQRTWPEDY